MVAVLPATVGSRSSQVVKRSPRSNRACSCPDHDTSSPATAKFVTSEGAVNFLKSSPFVCHLAWKYSKLVEWAKLPSSGRAPPPIGTFCWNTRFEMTGGWEMKFLNSSRAKFALSADVARSVNAPTVTAKTGANRRISRREGFSLRFDLAMVSFLSRRLDE